MTPGPIDIRALVALLAERIDELVAELLPGGHREGPEWRCGSISGDPGRSLGVRLIEPRRGIWIDSADPALRGDALDLVAQALFAGDKRRAYRWARAWLGLDAPEDERRARVAAHAAAERRAREAADRPPEEDKGKRDQGWRLWLQGQERLAGTPAAAYLAGRGLRLDRLGRQPRSLRYHPAAWSSEAQRPLPAMLAAVVAGSGRFVACHRTFLEPAPGGGWRKAGLVKPKLCLGRYAGGAIRLWRGEIADPETGEVKPAPRLGDLPDPDPGSHDPGRPDPDQPSARSHVAICEGIEDGLSIALACPEWRVLVAVALANMGRVTLPAAIRYVTIVADNDGANASAAGLLDRAADRLVKEGRQVRVVAPPAGIKDVNELLTKTKEAM